MITITGNPVYPKQGSPSLYDIGYGLSRIVRFAGQTAFAYTVLQHSIVVSALMPPRISVYGLIHDCGEAIISDQVSTWKNASTKADEKIVQARVAGSIGLAWPPSEDVQEQINYADILALRAEAEVLGHSTLDAFDEFPRDDTAIMLTEMCMASGYPSDPTTAGQLGKMYEDLVIEKMELFDGNI